MPAQEFNQSEPPHFRFWPQGLPKSLDYSRHSLFVNLENSAKKFPAKIFLNFYGREITYAEAAREIDALAGWLQQDARVKKGDRVALNLQNSPQFVLAFYAILRTDAIVVPINPMSKREELQHYLNDSGAGLMIAAQDSLEEIVPLIGATPLRKVLLAAYSDYLPQKIDSDFAPPEFLRAPRAALANPAFVSWRDARVLERKPVPHSAGAGDLACLPYTSGSTGRPKACMHTHATMMAATLMFATWEQCGSNTVALAPVPFFHVSGLTGTMNNGVYQGWTIVLMTRWDPVLAAKLIEKYKVTRWNCLPTMVGDVLSNPESTKRDLSSLKTISGGGAAMPEAVAKSLKEKLGVELIEGYGMTEFMSATHMNPPSRIKRQCLGIPIFDCEALVVDLDTGAPLPPDTQGEIVMRGPHIMQGYWNQPGATEESTIVIRGQKYLRTGDVGVMDEDGYFFINDRKKRMINAAGYKVWPVEVENFFYQHPAIQECCIIASPDERRGEQVKLVAVKKPGHDHVGAGDVIAWARERMANYKVPRAVEFVQALPRSGSGKILWRALQEKEFKSLT
jgi:fatty-acyl-CoA synthase